MTIAIQLLTVLIGALSLGGTSKEIHRFTVDGGGVLFSSSGSLELSGTIGQPDAGVMFGDTLQLTGGFWFAISPGDCDVDSGISSFDYVEFPDCVTGPEGATIQACLCLDFDDDGDLDLADFAAFEVVFSGP